MSMYIDEDLIKTVIYDAITDLDPTRTIPEYNEMSVKFKGGNKFNTLSVNFGDSEFLINLVRVK